MRRTFIALLLLCTALCGWSQDEVNFEFSDGISNAVLKQRMERQLSLLLTAINRAESAGGLINFTGINIEPSASMGITSLWENAHFRCIDDDIVEHCLVLKRNGRVYGYQARNIAIEMKPQYDNYQDEKEQEICVDFDTKGNISDLNITMGINQYSRLMKEGAEIEDLDERMQVIKFCEDLKNAYMKRDLQFMENIFSDDALIITGKVIMRQKAEIGMSQKDYEYTVKTKKEYLKKLREVFNNPRTGAINVNFREYRVKRHNAKPNYYGVTLIQDWNTDGYSDQGIVFLVWDFSNKEQPKIQVRTWQPMDTDESEVFTLKRFKLR